MRDSTAPPQTNTTPPPAPRSPAGWRARVWAALTLAAPSLPDDLRRRARLLQTLVVGLLALLTISLFGIYVFGWGAGSTIAGTGRLLFVMWPVLLVALGLSRARHQTLATLLTILVTSAVSWLLVLADPSGLPVHPELLFYPVVSIILAALLLPGALTLLTGLVNLIVLLLFASQLPAGYDPLGFVVWYVFITVLIGIASAVHRSDLARLERESQALADDMLARRQTEAALLESQQLFHNAFEFASIGVALVALDGRWTQVNPALCQLTGYTASELLATTTQAITHPDDRATDRLCKERVLSRQIQSYQLEKRYLHKLGHIVWVLVSASAVLGPTGQPIYVVVQAQDISERKQAVEALQDSQQHLTNAFDQAGIGMAWVARVGNYLRVNEALCTLTGYSAAELVTMSFADLTYPEDIPASLAMRDRVLTGELDAYQVEKRYRHKAGHAIWVLLTVKLLRDADGRALYFFSQIQDVNDRHAATEAVRESGERYRAMLQEAEQLRQFNNSIAEVMAEGLVLEDAAGHITLVNPRLQAMLGYTASELVGRNSLSLIAPAEQAAVQRQAQQRPAGLTSRYETRLLTRDGREIPALISGTPLSKDGVFTGTLATIIDISERKTAEEALFEANAKLVSGLREAEQRSRESALLNELNDLLQTCLSPDEAYELMAPVLTTLFPGDAGRLFIIPTPGQPAAQVAEWGPVSTAGPGGFAPDDCWALRRGRTHVVDLSPTETRRAPALVCPHMAEPWPAAYVCVPMVAQGETLGVLHLSRLAGAATALLTNAQWLENRERLAHTVGDSLALALANLRLRDRLRQQSIRDPLTGLFNRRYLEETLEREIHRARRADHPVGVIMLDIDCFKSFNDTLGHEAGDHVLREVGRLLRANSRGEDIACRYGGEEFTLLMPGAGSAATQERAARLRAAVAALEITLRGQVLPTLTVSAGVASCPEHGASGEAVVQAADLALYAAKAAGRNRVVVAGNGPST